jgi:cyclic pyranopterin phosphate synthase
MAPFAPLVDALGRPLRNLRLSVTDRCNLRCAYCMPEPDYVWLPREDILHFSEISRLVDVFASIGVDKIRLTGGEPLVRRQLSDLVRFLAAKRAIRDLALTTNGVLLADQAQALRDAGLHRITVSLDTLHTARFTALTRSDALDRVLAGIGEASRLFPGLKLDSVIMRGVNDDELVPLLEYGKRAGAEVRFIEYMDVGGATRWDPAMVMPREEMLAALTRHYGPIEPIEENGAAPADRFRLADGATFGVISSTTHSFCHRCDRSRLTADGMWYLCLYATRGADLRKLVRSGSSIEAIRELIVSVWNAREDRGAEDRMALGHRTPLVAASGLKKDPHLEMHTRGG